jgi:trans-2,3-dihydro-3-hydroxyanthranilate isomerase
MRRRFFTLDVFTDRKFAGNPLAVLLDSQDLEGAAMQAIAREFNLPETVFVLAAADPKHRARLRIFTPARELPFAGHPTVGTAVLLVHLDGGAEPREIVLAEEVGPVTCLVHPAGEGGRAAFDIPRMPERVAAGPDAAALASALGLDAADLGFDDFRPESWSAGNPFTFVPLRSSAAVGRARPDLAHWERAFGAGQPPGAFLFCRQVADPANSFHARMFAPAMGVAEDPATGSAVAAFAGLLAASGAMADGQHAIVIEQGYEMGRPSLLRLWLTVHDGKLAAATVGGDAVIVAEGTIEA